MKSSVAFKFDDFDDLEGRKTEEGVVKYSFVPIDEKEDSSRVDNLCYDKKKQFEILPIVKEYKTIKEFEAKKKERKIEDAVKVAVESIEDSAREKGYKEGLEKGRFESIQKNKDILNEKMENLASIIEETVSLKQNILSSQKKEICQLINVLVRWIILKELSNDEQYIERLLERLVLELQEKSNLLVRINKKEYDRMPEVLKSLEEKVGTLSNVRLRTEPSEDFSGVILESENALMDGSLEQQLKNLDKLFSF